mmetsp:Transcript_12321/g.36218  ORF Transcript_12321/g.36218 Transcript_12321/m.36218 type:complete len:107 (-) Transcript_12321:1276-1596(-)
MIGIPDHAIRAGMTDHNRNITFMGIRRKERQSRTNEITRSCCSWSTSITRLAYPSIVVRFGRFSLMLQFDSLQFLDLNSCRIAFVKWFAIPSVENIERGGSFGVIN